MLHSTVASSVSTGYDGLSHVLVVSDREGMAPNVALETVETDLSLALKCQLILSHGDGTVAFAKAVEVLTELRRLATLYLDDILNSQVVIESVDGGVR